MEERYVFSAKGIDKKSSLHRYLPTFKCIRVGRGRDEVGESVEQVGRREQRGDSYREEIKY